jgi:hypothetical protein
MSACKLTEETPANASLKGTTLFAKGDDCITETAVYLSKANARKSVSNVILFFHGWHVAKIEKNVFGPDTDGGENKLREGVDAADKDVVLIVPFLGHQEKKGGRIGLGNLKTKGIKAYLDQVLGLIIPGNNSTNIERLVLACHSGSDGIMRDATSVLGDDLKKKLQECWGFDCINSDGKFFGAWADGLPGVSFYFYVATGSVDYGHFPSHLVRAYGTPGNPKKPPMAKVFLAPGVNDPPLQSVPDDQVGEPFDAIQKKQAAALSDYEKLRLVLDPKLDGKKGEWETEVKKHHLKQHYEVVRDMLKPRIQRLFAGKP